MSGALLGLVLSAASVQLDAPQVSAELAEAVRTELSTAGFSSEGEPVVARVGLSPIDGAIDCTVEDRVTHKTVTRRLPYDANAPRANRKLAVQAVELLHASLAEARFAPPPAPVPPAVNAFLEQREPPAAPKWRLEASGGAAVLSGLGARPAVSIGGRYQLGPIELGARASTVVQTWTVTGTLGSADIGLADARLVADWPLEASVFTFRPELSFGALVGWANGHPTAHGYLGSGVTTAAAAPAVNVCAELPLNGWLAVEARAGAVFSLPAIEVDFGSTHVTRVGLPMFEISLGLSLR